MTDSKKKSKGGVRPKKLQINKETLKDLNARDASANRVKGGAPQETKWVTCSCGGGVC